ncbi:diguanylate cyclase [Thiobacillus sp.]|uniref:sensor domain-containing diguanylate cyclase n=1 Tax=Thiobacillus sp. TaxID=924 RepID=UPI0018225C50|nr:diguanylate cyclase [Thiobacillus sp.]MBC2730024.1 GGDEF domain-containing protein [Thiobacillus sp.]MBC2738761.1 GGDEF domain-containing protein [Thiobacillus sp.]MBC2760947.1 GGDEF domain-containing protein [Thiobacillus sp.]
MLVWLGSAPVVAQPLSAVLDHESAIGLSTEFLKEQDGRLTLPAAIAAYQAGQFSPGNSPVLNFGIGSKPAWIHFAVDNPTAAPLQKRLSIEIAWLDQVEVYVQYRGRTVERYRAGDTLPFAQRPVDSRYFVFDHTFEPGTSDVYIRLETPDPMVAPIYLLSPETSRLRQMQQEFSYGIVYGFLLALMAYNAILFASLRSSRYLYYALYLAMFVAMNVAYTGHGFAWFWPDSTTWQQWSNPVLMFLYGVSGLLFAIRFLDLQVYFPRVRKAVIGFCVIFGILLAAAILLDSQKYALLDAFVFAFLFSSIMLLLGIISVRTGQKPAQYFLIAALSAMVGALLTTLSVWGFIPHNSWTFRAVEIGMQLDATLLALALAYQLRVGQEERLRAERLAQMDPLTGLNNRRAFYDKTGALWSHAIRHGHPTSVMLLDIDLFKQVNDAYGHAHGDEVLKATAAILRQSIRLGDVLARWGGEEFIVFLPETDRDEATKLAERLRTAIAGMRVPNEAGASAVTASFGIAQRTPLQLTLDALIACADDCLYQSKQRGRNRVTTCPAEPAPVS